MKKSDVIFTVLLIPLDLLMFFLAGISAYFLRLSDLVSNYRPVLFNLPLQDYLFLLFFAGPILILTISFSGLYRIRKRGLFEEFFQIIVACSAALLAAVFFTFIYGDIFDSRFIILAAWFFSIFSLFIGRVTIRHIQKYFISKYNIGIHKILLIGDKDVLKYIQDFIKKNPGYGYRIEHVVESLDINFLKKIIENNCIDTIILGLKDYSHTDASDLVELCLEKNIVFKFIPDLFDSRLSRIAVEQLGLAPLLEIKRTPLEGWGKIVKRMFDVVFSFILLCLFLPGFLLISLLIKMDSSGPVFVKLKRVSQGKEFFMYKFRSMIKDAEKMKDSLKDLNERKDGPLFKIKKDPRITKIGSILRKMRLDELPQLLNVLKGEMSLVGPRPHEPQEIINYQKHHKRLFVVKAGATGFAQIYGSSSLPFEEEVRLDAYYIENWSLLLDLKIVLKTIFLFLFGDSTAV